ncbi:MAG: hypothetical protein JF589_01395 [Gemmatimonadetes bacterium]|jgi:hypothetical protein|nr:hypothetical protein [Gemmatimonadota bacterium]
MTPDNGAFTTAAYTIAAIIYLAYVLSLKLRLRRLRERAITLEAAARPRSDRPEGA